MFPGSIWYDSLQNCSFHLYNEHVKTDYSSLHWGLFEMRTHWQFCTKSFISIKMMTKMKNRNAVLNTLNTLLSSSVWMNVPTLHGCWAACSVTHFEILTQSLPHLFLLCYNIVRLVQT